MLERKHFIKGSRRKRLWKCRKTLCKHSLGVWFFLIRSLLTVSLFEYIAYLRKFMNTDLGLGGSQIALNLIRIGRKRNIQRRKAGKWMDIHCWWGKLQLPVPPARRCHLPKTAWLMSCGEEDGQSGYSEQPRSGPAIRTRSVNWPSVIRKSD